MLIYLFIWIQAYLNDVLTLSFNCQVDMEQRQQPLGVKGGERHALVLGREIVIWYIFLGKFGNFYYEF